MLQGSCHCGAVQWTFDGFPETATSCNCTTCRRYAGLWAYGHEDEDVRTSGPTSAYIRGDRSLATHFCPVCGSIAYWRSLEPGQDGRRRMGVNLRMADPDAVAAIPVKHFNGLDWQDPPTQDGRTVGDMWF